MMMRKLALCALVLAGCGTDYTGDDTSYTPPVPVANDDQATVAEDTLLPLATLLGNDVDVGAIDVVDLPAHGIVTSSGYVPQPGFFGTDTFTYTGRRAEYTSETSAIATVTVEVTSDGIPYEQSDMLAPDSLSDVVPGDIDGDGRVDLLGIASSKMQIFHNVGTGPGDYRVESQVFEGGTSSYRLAATDLDGDGRLDVITDGDDGVTMFRNITQAGQPLAFAAPAYLGSTPIWDVEAVDMNADGVADLVALDPGLYGGPASLHTWINQSSPGTLAFGAETTFALPPGAGRLNVVDLDGDNGRDFAVLSADKVTLLRNATAASAAVVAFEDAVERATGSHPLRVVYTDLDGDLAPELAVLHNNGVLWVYENRGGAALDFEAARVLDVDPELDTLAAFDLDGNATLDLIGASGASYHQLTVLRNTSQPQAFSFDEEWGIVGDTETRQASWFGQTSELLFVDLDGTPPLEAVATTAFAGLRVLYGP